VLLLIETQLVERGFIRKDRLFSRRSLQIH
jgi:hypothetical protein